MANRHLLLLLTLLISGVIHAADVATSADTITASPSAATLFNVDGGVTAIVSGSNDFSPYYIHANREGGFTQSNATLIDATLTRELSTEGRFTYGFGAQVIGGWTSGVDYTRCDAEGNIVSNPQHPARIWLQNLWAAVKFRGVYARIGMSPDGERSIVRNPLGSGDIVMSDNARPIPRLSVGFIDFQDIPFTNHWVQIRGEVSYGKFVDADWLTNHYNRINSFITTGAWMHYASCHFRTNPAKRFSATIGMQHAVQFGGKTQKYRNGVCTSVTEMQAAPKDFFNALLPWKGGGSGDTYGDAAYYSGNHLGSWDLLLRYTLADGSEISAYLQSPWEDGSGIGKLNGADGVWGVSYKSTRVWPSQAFTISGVTAEYIDFTNQSGPMHWAPDDFPGTAINGQATGADDYYNNYTYNGWTNYGMTIGSPLVAGTVFNTDGYMRITDNRVRGFHLGIGGSAARMLDWRFMVCHRTSWGTPFLPALSRRHATSIMADVHCPLPNTPRLTLVAAIAFDTGSLLGNNLGAAIAVRYAFDVPRSNKAAKP